MVTVSHTTAGSEVSTNNIKREENKEGKTTNEITVGEEMKRQKA